MLSRRLKRRGFEVLLALDGGQAIDLARERRPAPILMDICLPELDGFEATRRIKSDPATAAIPILALTAHAMEVDRARRLEAGCDDYDTKPVELSRLLEKMQALLGREPLR